MLFHILKKDLKRKKTMNVILLLFIIMAATFLASSVNNLITITGAVDHFLELSKTPDFLVIMASENEKNEMDQFLQANDSVSEYGKEDMYALTDENIQILECAADPQKHQYDRGTTLAVGEMPENFLKVFDQDGHPFTLNHGEIALPKLQAETNDLQVGDKLQLTCGDSVMDFTLAVITKDAVFGTEMMGFKRAFLTGEDYAQLMEGAGDSRFHTLIYSINYLDQSSFEQEYKEQNFHIISSVDRNTIKLCYIFDMLIAGILIVVSVCLILIAFLILRFTIVFTLQEDYKEIGIMKAIGIKDISIKGIYMLKYLAIALAGSFVGFWLSFPFQKLLLSQALINIIVQEVNGNAGINILCALAIVVIVLLFCYRSTSRVKKYTAIEAIRNGSNGERYHAKNILHLYKRKHMLPGIYLAWNDIFSHIRQYQVLIVIFCIGTLLILLPLTAIHTLKDEGIVRSFGKQTADVFMDTRNMETYITSSDETLLLSDIDRIEKEFAKNGMPADVWVETGYTVPCYGSDPEDVYSYYTMQQIGKQEDDYDVLSGRVPELSNEIMVTEKTADTLKVEIGDSIYFKYADHTEEFVITGIFQTMMNLGDGFRVSQSAQMEYSYISGVFAMEAKITSDLSEKELQQAVQDIFPEYDVNSPNEYVSSMIGGILDKMDLLKLFILGMVLVIDVLITLLMMKTLVSREHGEIAMLKSVGFPDGTIRIWQSVRILLVLIGAILLGVVLAKLIAPITMGPIFAMMGGTSIHLVVEPIETYLVMPAILLSVTGLAAYLCSGEVKKVDLKEINTLE